MSHLERLISGLSKEQVRFYKLFTARTEHAHERKDILLFDAIRKKGEELDEEALVKQLYPDGDKNAFYRLKNRLFSDLNKSLSVLHYDDSDFMLACHMLALSHYYSQRNKLEEARYYLRKSEKAALALEHNELLDIIYGEYIRLSHESHNINPEQYIQLRRDNRKQQEGLRAIDDLLAVVSYRLKTSQNFSPDKNPLLDLLKSTVDDFVKDRDLRNSPRLRFRMYQAVTQILLQRHDYRALETYLMRTFREFERDNLFTRDNHDTKLQMLTYMVNTLFKNNKLRQSLQWAEKLKAALEAYNRMLFDKYSFFYYNALVINYSILDRDKAIDLLNELKDDSRIKANAFHHLFVYLNLGVLLFDRKEYKESIKHFSRLYLMDGYKTADASLRLNVAVCELIPRFELQQYDVIEYKSAQLRRDYKALLADDLQYGERELLKLLGEMADKQPLRKHPDLSEKVRGLIDWMRKNKDRDSFIIDFPAWMESRL